jgi:hypothetical protein
MESVWLGQYLPAIEMTAGLVGYHKGCHSQILE